MSILYHISKLLSSIKIKNEKIRRIFSLLSSQKSLMLKIFAVGHLACWLGFELKTGICPVFPKKQCFFVALTLILAVKGCKGGGTKIFDFGGWSDI